jgi:hypothetical protein
LKAPKNWRTQRGSSFPGRKQRGHALDFEGIVAGQEAEKQDEMAKKEGKFSESAPDGIFSASIPHMRIKTFQWHQNEKLHQSEI